MMRGDAWAPAGAMSAAAVRAALSRRRETTGATVSALATAGGRVEFVRPPDARRILIASSLSLCVGLLITPASRGLHRGYPRRLTRGLAAAAGGLGLVAVAVAFAPPRLGDYRHSADEDDFELIVRRSER